MSNILVAYFSASGETARLARTLAEAAGMKAEETEARKLGIPIRQIPSLSIFSAMEQGKRMNCGETNQGMEAITLC